MGWRDIHIECGITCLHTRAECLCSAPVATKLSFKMCPSAFFTSDVAHATSITSNVGKNAANRAPLAEEGLKHMLGDIATRRTSLETKQLTQHMRTMQAASHECNNHMVFCLRALGSDFPHFEPTPWSNAIAI